MSELRPAALALCGMFFLLGAISTVSTGTGSLTRFFPWGAYRMGMTMLLTPLRAAFPDTEFMLRVREKEITLRVRGKQELPRP